MHGFLESAVRPPAVADQQPRIVSVYQLGGLCEAATRPDRLHRDQLGRRYPQPDPYPTHPPSGLVHDHHQTAADRGEQCPIGRRAALAQTSQRLGHPAPRDPDPADLLEHGRRLGHRQPQLVVEAGGQRQRLRPHLRCCRATRLRGLQRVTTAHPPPTPPTAPDMDHKAPPDRPGRQDLLLPLLLDPGLLQLPAAVRVRACAGRVHCHRLVHVLRRLPVSMPTVLLAALPPRTFGVGLRLSLRERRRLPLARSQRGFQPGLQLAETQTQLLVLGPQPLVLVEDSTQFVALVVGGHGWIVVKTSLPPRNPPLATCELRLAPLPLLPTVQLRFDLPPPEATALGPGVWLHETEDGGVVFVHGFMLYSWRSHDIAARRVAAVQLVRNELADEVSVRDGFRVPPDELQRLMDRFHAPRCRRPAHSRRHRHATYGSPLRDVRQPAKQVPPPS